MRAFRRSILLLAIVGVVAGGVWHASRRVPTGAASGEGINGSVAQEPAKTVLRIGTFNIHGCTGTDGRRDPQRVAQCLADLDFAGLNEVHGPWLWEADNQAALLGRALDRGWLFAPAVRQWYHYEFGNGLLSTLRITAWERIPLPGESTDLRNMVLATIAERRGSIRVLVTHATRRNPSRHDEQLAAITARFLALAEPAILLGDLNAAAEEPRIGELLAAPGVVEPFRALRATEPPQRIDWIFLRGLRPVRVGVVERGASDHPLIWAEVETGHADEDQAATRGRSSAGGLE